MAETSPYSNEGLTAPKAAARFGPGGGSLIEISTEYINSLAPDAASLANGRKLAEKGSFTRLSRDEAETLLFGECAGSGKSPYLVSVDFSGGGAPVCRCSCPSRKFPCKHALGLMFAKVLGQDFSVAPVPEDVAEKRRKLAAREEKKAQPPAESGAKAEPSAGKKKSGSAAALKKDQARLDGLELAEKALMSLMRAGFGSVTPQAAAELEQQVKQLGDFFLPGVQAEFRAWLANFNSAGEPYGRNASSGNGPASDMEAAYSRAFDGAVRLGLLIKKGREYLSNKIAQSGAGAPDDLEMEGRLGHAWQLTELAALGLVEAPALLKQLAFTSYENHGSLAYEDLGVWVDLKQGRVLRTLNIRPFKAAKRIAQDDSVFDAAEIPSLHIYPGGPNPRVRWDAFKLRASGPKDHQTLIDLARLELTPLLKEVKDTLKSPLAEPGVLALVRFEDLALAGEDLVMSFPDGQRLKLSDWPANEWPDTLPVLRSMGAAAKSYRAALLNFFWRVDDESIFAAPLALVKEDGIFRLAF